MVELVGDIRLYQVAELFQIDHKSRFRIWIASHCHDKIKIMTMPILIRAWTKNFNILLWRPSWVVKLMGRVEVLFSADVDHILIANITNVSRSYDHCGFD